MNPHFHKDNYITCPNCGRKLFCSCEACMADELQYPENYGFLIWSSDCVQDCNNCGLSLHADDWLDLSLKQWEESESQKFIKTNETLKIRFNHNQLEIELCWPSQRALIRVSQDDFDWDTHHVDDYLAMIEKNLNKMRDLREEKRRLS